MSSVKVLSAYWKQFSVGNGETVRNTNLFFVDLIWDELPYVINQLNNLGFSDEELKRFPYQERTKLLNKSPVLVARHFWQKVPIFFKEPLLDRPLGKTKYYALHIELQERRRPHVHAFIWTLDAPKFENETVYLDFVENSISSSLSDSQKQPDLFKLVKTFHIYSHSRTCFQHKKNKCRFSYGCFAFFLTEL